MTNSSSLSRARWSFLALTAALAAGAVMNLAFEPNLRDAAVLGALALLSGCGLWQIHRASHATREIGRVLESAARGNLEERVTLLDDGGDMLRLAQDANRLLDITDAFVREALATLACVRDGKHFRRIIERGMVGSFKATSATMNQAVDAIDGRLSGFAGVMGEFERTVGEVTGRFADAMADLTTSAEQMRGTASDTEQRTTTIGSSAEETAVTVATVAAATEELTASVEDIARQAEAALSISARAGDRMSESQGAIKDLSHAVDEIMAVVGLIRQVAEQTKLLALNATIEAARAGEAGRGFQVVATEVKALAGQTASATHTIADRIQAVDSCAHRCMSALNGIAGIVEEVSGAAMSISASVKQQTSATQEIARSMQLASRATDEVSSNVTTVAEAAGTTGRLAGHVAGAAEEMADETERLEQSVAAFLGRAREVAGAARAA